MKRSRQSPAFLAALFRQLADALKAGLSPRDTLAILAADRDLGKRQAQLIARLRDALSAGQPLASALEADAETFPAEVISMVRAGERDRALHAALDLVATDYELRAMQAAAVHGTLTWPLVLVSVLALVVAVVMIFVVPAFKQVYTSFGADLPVPTLVLMEVSDWVVAYWWLLALLVIAAFYWVRRRHLPGHATADRALMRVPFIRAYLVKTFLARLSHVMAASAETLFPLAPALAYLRATAGNRRLADIAASLEARVNAGDDLVAAVRDTPHMPGQLAVALELGARAKTPTLGLKQIVSLSESEAARSLMRLEQASLVSMYLCLGLVIGFVVIALYLPIFKMGQAV